MFKNRSKTVNAGNYRLKAFWCSGQWWCLAEARASNIPGDVRYSAWVEMFLLGDPDNHTTREDVLHASLVLVMTGLAETRKAYLRLSQ